ncbi:MAG: hypothetical protein IPM42_06075 [Saprospiraceae bacterium]|nr:hypothetical protein [Saprospiraceae bacterium]
MANITELEKIIQLKGHSSAIYALADIPDSPYFLSAGGDGYIVRWQKDGSQQDGLLIAKVEGKVFSLCLLNNGKILVAGDFAGDVYWIDMLDNKVIKRVQYHKGSVFGMWPDKRHLFTVSGDGFLVRWSLEFMMPEESIKLSGQGLRCILGKSEDNTLYIGASDCHIYHVRKDTLEVMNKYENVHDNSVFCITRSNPYKILTGGRDAFLKVHHLPDFRKEYEVAAHWYTINQILSIPELNCFVTASRDKSFRIWDADKYQLLKSIDMHKEGHINSVNSLLWFINHNILATAGDDRSIILWKWTVE